MLFPYSAHEAIWPGTRPLITLKQDKEGTHKVEVNEDKRDCDITGLAIAIDGRRLITDHGNFKVKLFSRDMKALSYVSVPGGSRDIAVISDIEAAVTTDNNSLVILDISKNKISVKTTTQLSYDVYGISSYKDKCVVTSPDSKPPSVKLIDITGRVYWSVPFEQHRETLFSWPSYVSSHVSSSTVIVADEGYSTLTLFNGDTGDVITRRQLNGKYPKGVTTDSTGNIYACYYETDEVSFLSRDLSEETILLSGKDGLSGLPQAIAYDDTRTKHQFIISCMVSGTVDCFKLSHYGV